MRQRILHHQSTVRDADDEPQTPPEDEHARDDGLLRLPGGGEHAHEGAREEEADADGRGDLHGHVDGFGEPPTEQAEADTAGEEEHGAPADGPLETAGARDELAGECAGAGGEDRGEDEAEAGVCCVGEQHGLEVQRPFWSVTNQPPHRLFQDRIDDLGRERTHILNRMQL